MHSRMHLRGDERKALTIPGPAIADRGHLVFADLTDATLVLQALQTQQLEQGRTPVDLRPSELFALGLLHEISHAITTFAVRMQPKLFERTYASISADLKAPLDAVLLRATEAFPPESVVQGALTPQDFLASEEDGVLGREAILEEQLLLEVARANPAFKRAADLFDEPSLHDDENYASFSKLLLPAVTAIDTFSHAKNTDASRDLEGHEGLVAWLTAPALAAPKSLEGQLEYALVRFRHVIEPAGLWKRALYARSLLSDESRFFQRKNASGVFEPLSEEERVFSVGAGGLTAGKSDVVQYARDTNWMPNLVLLAKSTLVWLTQLSARYGKDIRFLSDIPDEELQEIASRGFTGLWPIGLWKRSEASRKIKVLAGQKDAAASAYSVQSYEIAAELGGEAALEDLRDRAAKYGLRLACDLVPNHWGLDADWMIEHPERFVQTAGIPFPSYRFTGPDLSSDARVTIQLEDAYWTQTDAAVVFKYTDHRDGTIRYVYHGNDGTSTPWNDTAQLDYLKENVREAVTQEIVSIAKRFPIIRFDAAMVLAKQHVRRLWYPALRPNGTDGDCIASRGAFAMSDEEFDRLMPTEFWRDVADRVAKEAPDTLLLAEAFWMMEGYFVRSLGMHRVYNSAFMNMLRDEQNAGYRKVLRTVLETDARVLERFVNFMNNPDELPAIVGFGDGNKYFGVCTLLATMPGLPMFGHGQFEGFSEKYGMEYRRALHAETPNPWLLARHEREIVPLLRERYRFSGTESFVLLDFVAPEGHVDEDILAYANGRGKDVVVVIYNNTSRPARGMLRGLSGSMALYDFFDGHEVTPAAETSTFDLGAYGVRVLSAMPRPLSETEHAADTQDAPPSTSDVHVPIAFSLDDEAEMRACVADLMDDADAGHDVDHAVDAAMKRIAQGRSVVETLRQLALGDHEALVLAVTGFPLREKSVDPLALLLLAWATSLPAADVLARGNLDPQLFKIARYVLAMGGADADANAATAARAPGGKPASLTDRVATWFADAARETRALLGVHEALGKHWFHREAFHRMLACEVVRRAFEEPEALAELVQEARELRALGETAGYDVERFTAALSQAPSAMTGPRGPSDERRKN